MNAARWQRQGRQSPDAPEAQRDVWALLGRLHEQLATALAELALRTAEPTWAATLAEHSERARALSRQLLDEAGPEALERLAQDEAWREFDALTGEVLTSGHVPSLIVVGYANLGELGVLPARLLEDLAGAQARLLYGRLVSAEAHRPLARLFSAADPSATELETLRRLVRHAHGLLFTVYATWRQTFHILGVDGEVLQEQAAGTARAASHALSLRVTTADLAPFRV
ncbi:MAG: hypothetical protein ACT4PU_00395 [Planctomycetota bacterium]